MFYPFKNELCKQLNIRLPIIQAPMAGGVVTPALIAAVSRAGGLGSLPLGYLSVDEARLAIQQCKGATTSRFSVNLFVPSPDIMSSEKNIEPMLKHINKYRQKMALPVFKDIPRITEADFDETLDMLVSEKISLISFTFGVLSQQIMNRLRRENILLTGTATSIKEGLMLQASGCHAVIAQGYEAGGHRGGFSEEDSVGLIGSMALIPQMVDALDIPVIASGGIMDGRGVAAALILGASAVQMGTAFLTCAESKASAMHKQLILAGTETDTCITSVFTGKPVRSIKNSFISATEKSFKQSELPAYPLQHYLSTELRKQANKSGQADCAGLWSGQGARLSRSLPAEILMAELEKEMTSAFIKTGQ